MRRFSSYGPIIPSEHYHAPRTELIEKGLVRLTGKNLREGGQCITVWAPRQCGKTWVMQEVGQKLKTSDEYHVGIFSLESLEKEKKLKEVLTVFVERMTEAFHINFPPIKKTRDIRNFFTKTYFQKPVILIIDEFDSLEENFINEFAAIFRDIFIGRSNERNKESKDKTHLLHGLALIGVRGVLGIENIQGSPFNIQQSLHIPDLTYDEVKGMFQWYERESGQQVDEQAVLALFDETRGQPGLTCWFGELLTDKYNPQKDKPITMENFKEAYAAAVHILPNNNILNIISKAKVSPYKETLLELFKTEEKIVFNFDDKNINYLYMNGVIDQEKVGKTGYYVRFASPFVQKRLFNYFSNEFFAYMGRLVDPFENLSDVITETELNIRNLMKCYGRYLAKNKEWLLKDVPRRKDLRVYEAIYHFNLYMFLTGFLENRGGKVFPQFPTGNGIIDLVVRYKDKVYGLELKSFTQELDYKRALLQAARYGRQMQLEQVTLVFFVEAVSEEKRQVYEADFNDPESGVMVAPILIATG
jgi:hypothetical protein